MDIVTMAGRALRLLEPETAHGVTLWALRRGIVPAVPADDDAVLACRLWGRDFANPVGLAAGFDKNAQVADAMLRFGFGFVEVGTVTPRPQRGNPRPRLFRLSEDRAVINRLGFNNSGLAAMTARLANRRHRHRGVVGANFGANRDSADRAKDYVTCCEALRDLVDYLVINVSSPSTPGLRTLQDRDALNDLLARLPAASRRPDASASSLPPILVKIAPDLDRQGRAAIAEVALARGIDGLIVGNTTRGVRGSLKSRHRTETGGLSGTPLLGPSTAHLRELYQLTKGRLPLIGTGGVGCGGDAYAKIRAGASLVQLYTALIFEGPGLVGRIKAELAALLKADGFARVGDAVGADASAAR